VTGSIVAVGMNMRMRLRHADNEWRIVDSSGNHWVTFAGRDAPGLAKRHVQQLAAEFSDLTRHTEKRQESNPPRHDSPTATGDSSGSLSDAK
jgi:hypothetical protein